VGRRAGVDFPYLAWQLINGVEFPVQRGREGVRWVRGLTDLLATLQQVRSGHFSLIEHLRSLRLPIEFAVWAADDPLPALCEIPAMIAARWRISRKMQDKPPILVEKADFSSTALSSDPILAALDVPARGNHLLSSREKP
jgi:predicted ATP-grasp superfamily ATP-dependent carboligase